MKKTLLPLILLFALAGCGGNPQTVIPAPQPPNASIDVAGALYGPLPPAAPFSGSFCSGSTMELTMVNAIGGNGTPLTPQGTVVSQTNWTPTGTVKNVDSYDVEPASAPQPGIYWLSSCQTTLQGVLTACQFAFGPQTPMPLTVAPGTIPPITYTGQYSWTACTNGVCPTPTVAVGTFTDTEIFSLSNGVLTRTEDYTDSDPSVPPFALTNTYNQTGILTIGTVPRCQ